MVIESTLRLWLTDRQIAAAAKKKLKEALEEQELHEKRISAKKRMQLSVELKALQRIDLEACSPEEATDVLNRVQEIQTDLENL